jgi:PEP-CTERM motif-containing protein
MSANHVRACIGLTCLLLVRIAPAAAAPVTFDDIVSAPACNSAIPAGYGGLNWSNFQIECDADYMGTYGNPYGSPSGEYAAFNAFGLAAVELTATAEPFTFGGASFTSWADRGAFSDPSAPFSAQTLALIGYRPGDLPDLPTYYLELALDPTMYVAQQLGWTGLERLAFVSGDGVAFNINGLSWLMDDVDVSVERTVVPEPGTLSMLGAGLLSLAMSRRRRQPRSSR